MVTSGLENGSRAQTNGLLAVTASQTSNRPGAIKLNPKLKVIIRRLAPGLTESEFTSILGDEWKLGNGRVDWCLYKSGKDSKDPSKPSRPSRAYLHLTNEAHLLALSEVVQQAVFEDALATFTNPCLIGPPSVEFAPYSRTPGGRRRTDARAGTIDQDPEFMAFLEGLANPTSAKELNADTMAEGAAGKHERVTTTPLVQFLKDKKANKTKEAAMKLAKKQEAQLKNKPGKESPSSIEESKRKVKDIKVDKSIEKAAKEAVRILNREAASKSGVSQTASASSSEVVTPQTPPPKLDVTKVPGRQRSAVVAAHIRMLQRDLGLTPAQAHRQVRRDTADAQKAERVAAATADKVASESKEASSSSQLQATAGPSKLPPTHPRKARGKGVAAGLPSELSKNSPSVAPLSTAAPVVLLKKPDQNPSQATASTSHALQSTPTAPASLARKPQSTVPVAGTTQAFVKHANPSQGVTEALLKEAMEKFGAVSMVEIDKRKGFAYVDFVDADGLKKAMAANPISVAQGTVQVMPRKGTALPPEKKPVHQPSPPSRGNLRGGRGGTVGRRGGRGGRGGGNTASSENRAPSTAPTGPAVK